LKRTKRGEGYERRAVSVYLLYSGRLPGRRSICAKSR
jgi:hypothetical protein